MVNINKTDEGNYQIMLTLDKHYRKAKQLLSQELAAIGISNYEIKMAPKVDLNRQRNKALNERTLKV